MAKAPSHRRGFVRPVHGVAKCGDERLVIRLPSESAAAHPNLLRNWHFVTSPAHAAFEAADHSWTSPSSTRCRRSSSKAFSRLATTIVATAFPIKLVEGACVDPRYLRGPTTHPRGEARQACSAPSERGRRVADNYQPASATRHHLRSLEAFQHSSSCGQKLHPTPPPVVSRNPHPCASLQQA